MSLVSICIPTYNGEAFIKDALGSILIQDYKHLEVIISDDNSSDNTLQIVEKFRQETKLPVYIFNHKPNGIGANWNNCIKQANGEYIKFLFQDDVLLPKCISMMVNLLTNNPELGLVACKRSFIVEQKLDELINNWINKYKNLQIQFENNNPITFLDESLFYRQDFLSSPLNKIGEPTTTMFRKNIINAVGFFDENLVQILDYVFYYRLLKHYPIAIINQELVAFRIHKTQATNVNRKKKINDYKLYHKILYSEFYSYLNPRIQSQLASEFSIFTKIKDLSRRAYRKIFR